MRWTVSNNLIYNSKIEDLHCNTYIMFSKMSQITENNKIILILIICCYIWVQASS